MKTSCEELKSSDRQGSVGRFQSYALNKALESYQGTISDKSLTNSPRKKVPTINRNPNKFDDNRYHSARDVQTPIINKLQDSISMLELDDSQYKSRQYKQI